MEHPAVTRQRLLSSILLLLLCTTISGLTEVHAQVSQDEPYFSLSSQKTFKSDEKPAIHLYTNNVSSLEFRVYRVNDVPAFFKSLEEHHRFGGQARQMPTDLTVIERFHQFKRNIRTRIVNTFRAQYTQESRSTIRQRMEAKPAPVNATPTTPGGPRIETYPAIPLINPQQVVAVWRQPVPTIRRWNSETISFDVPGKGVYLVEATEGTLRAYTIAIVTDIALITKSSAGRILTFAAERMTGKPIADLPVSMILGGEVVAEGRTGADGMFEKSLSTDKAESLLVLARMGDDIAVSSEYGFSISTDPDRNLMGYVYSERPIYRPGHTVYFKGIVRATAGEVYRLPSKKQVEIEIQDSQGESVFRKALPLSTTGTFNGEFKLSEGAKLGHYSITTGPPAFIFGSFEVEEYKKPEYEVKVTPDRNRVLQGENITALVDARYFFGEPVANAKVTYVVHTSPYWYFPADEEFDEFDNGDASGFGGEQLDQGQGQLDAEGKLRVVIPTRVVDANTTRGTRDVRYRIEARVTDQGNREIAGSGSVIATYASFVLNVSSDRYVHNAGSSGKFTIKAEDYDKRPIETDVRVELSRWRWQDRDETVLWSTSVRTSAAGDATVEVPFQNPGSFRVKAIARSPENRDVIGTHYAWVSGASDDWYGSGRERVQIVPDKSSYAPGETARVLIVTGVPEAYVLVTTEGRSLQSPQIVHATSPTITVEVPIRAESTPNFFVNAAFLKDNELYSGGKSIRVPPIERQLAVEIQPSKPEFKPSEPATYVVTTKDFAGKPVAAEVSFGLVDEAIYAIRPEAARDIVKVFYGTTYNRVSTNSSLSYYFNGSAGKRAIRLTGLRQPSALAQLKPEKLLQPKVRKAFPDTALWLADVRTDENGRATVRVDFPDALTTWRATARAVTADTKVGSTIQKTIVRKNLILRLAVPRFFTQGDEVTISVLVHNYLQNEKTARISLEASGLQIIEGGTKDVVIPSRADAKVDWKVKAGSIGEVKLLGKALTDEESDAMELTLPVIPFGVKLSTSNAGSLAATADFTTDVRFPAGIEPGSRALEIGITPSIAGAIFGGLDYLTSFPYGCTEQTVSSFLPNVVVANALKQLNVKSNVDDVELAKKIRDGLARLYQFQHEDGGWGWWQTDDSAPFMTAYVVAGLSQARDAGINIQSHRLVNGSTYLGQQFDASTMVIPDLRAYLLYALSYTDQATAARIDGVWNQRDRLSAYGLALLGVTLDRLNDPRVQEVITLLERQVKTDDREAWWPMTTDPLMDFEADSTAEATAFALKLLARRLPESPLLPKAALWLVNHRNEGFYWYSTKQTAMVIYGLTDYLKASGELKPNFSVQVFVNDRQVVSRNFTAADALSPNSPVIRIPASQITADQNRIRIVKNGSGLLYWNTRGEYYSTEERFSRTGSVALNLLRDYFRMVPERVNEKIVYGLEPLDGPVKSGDVVAVRLTVSGGSWRYLHIEDPIPAGTEFIERDDLYELKDKPAWWARWYAQREFRDDRAAFFQTYFNGQTQHFYLLKVVNPGTFKASAARVQPMYQPQYLATTDSRSFAVQP